MVPFCFPLDVTVFISLPRTGTKDGTSRSRNTKRNLQLGWRFRRDSSCFLEQNQAERQGFEPWDELPRLRFSRPNVDPRKAQVYQEIRNHAHSEVTPVVP